MLDGEVLAFNIAQLAQARGQRDHRRPRIWRFRLGLPEDAQAIGPSRQLRIDGDRHGDRTSQCGQQEAAAIHH
jgi:hypothetical protein